MLSSDWGVCGGVEGCCLLPACCLLLPAFCLLLTAARCLPAARCPLPAAACCLLPAAYLLPAAPAARCPLPPCLRLPRLLRASKQAGQFSTMMGSCVAIEKSRSTRSWGRQGSEYILNTYTNTGFAPHGLQIYVYSDTECVCTPLCV